jgi:ribosomal protein S18 acetylase RimI-like enzyme
MGLVTIRPAVRTDLDQISWMDAESRSDQSHRATIEGAICREECLVALDGPTPLGFGVMNHEFFGRGFVLLIYVDAAHRRRHIATCLLDEFERRCKTNQIFASANLSNLAMQALLTARGYALSGIVQDLDPGDPEIFYSKRLR